MAFAAKLKHSTKCKVASTLTLTSCATGRCGWTSTSLLKPSAWSSTTKRLTKHMRLQILSWQTAALLLTGANTPVWAQTQDTVTFTASATQMTDSNLFRLPASTDFITRIGKPSAEEHIGITSLALNFSKAYSQQRIELGLNLIDYKYQNFSYLSFTASNYNAAWRWALTPRLVGSLSTDRKET